MPAAVLIKPYTIDELLRAVREVLRVDNYAQAHTATVPARQDQPTGSALLHQGERRIRAPIPGSAQPPRRILVVEDDSDIRQLNTEVLVHWCYQDAAKTGRRLEDPPNHRL